MCNMPYFYEVTEQGKAASPLLTTSSCRKLAAVCTTLRVTLNTEIIKEAAKLAAKKENRKSNKERIYLYT